MPDSTSHSNPNVPGRRRKRELVRVARVDAVEMLMEERRTAHGRVRMQIGEDHASDRAILEGTRPRAGRGTCGRREEVSPVRRAMKKTGPSRSDQPEGLATLRAGRGRVPHRHGSSRNESGDRERASKPAGPARRRRWSSGPDGQVRIGGPESPVPLATLRRFPSSSQPVHPAGDAVRDRPFWLTPR